MNDLTWVLRVEGEGEDETWVELVGNMNESFDGSRLLLDLHGARRITFDCGGVTRINSEGVRQWINMIRRLRREERRIFYVRCPLPLVAQINMLPAMSAGVTVLSVLAPYVCDATGEETERLLAVADLEDPTAPPVFVHPKEEGAEFELDDDPRRFFAFLLDPATE